MSDELLKELIQALRDLRSGAPEAFEILVQQRAEFAAVRAFSAFGIGAVMTVLLASLSIYICRLAGRIVTDGSYDDRPTVCVMLGGALGLGALSSILIGATTGCGWLATATAPLGEVLNMLGGAR